MTIAELKSSLIHQISEVDDPEFFEALKVFLQMNIGDKIYYTSLGQREGIERGMRQIENGEGISDDELDGKVKKWLEEK